MNPSSVMIGFMMLVMGYILGQLAKEATEEYMERKKNIDEYKKEQQRQKDWKLLTKKEPDHE